MNIAIDTQRINEALAKKVHATVSQSHNFVEVCMFGISRRTLMNLKDALCVTEFKRTGREDGCVYYLEDGSVAERFGGTARVYRMERVCRTVLRPRVAKIRGLFTDLPRVALTTATKTALDTGTLSMQRVTRRQFITKHTFTNSRGYEYVFSVSTPCVSAAATQSLGEAETALVDSAKQRNEFRIRFHLSDYNHSCYYYCMNHGMDIVTAHTVEALLAQASADCGDFYDLFLREAVAVWREDTSQTAASVVHRASQPLECEQSMSSDEQTALELAKRRKHGEKEVVHCKVCGSDLTTQEGKQMRAADEPETQFRKCLKCKFKWKTED